MTRMESGRMSLRAITRLEAGIGEPVVKLATCPSACTPASVRPDPWTTVSSRVTRAIASDNVPCTVCKPGWICHPAKSVPSYASVNLKLRVNWFTSPETFRQNTGVLNLLRNFQLQLRELVVRYTNLFPEPAFNLAEG